MRIADEFRVSVPPERAWPLLLDIERVAPCLPGAQLQEVDGDEYRGIVKVKVGPITAQYKGSAKIAEADEAARRMVIRAVGRDTRGQGNASATITATLRPDGQGTIVKVDTDLAITGKVAQLGRGVLADVSSKLLGQFVETLETDVLAAPTEVVDLVKVTEVIEVVTEPTGNGSGPRRIDAPEPEPVSLLETAGAPLLWRIVPIVAVTVVVLWWARRRRRRRRIQTEI